MIWRIVKQILSYVKLNVIYEEGDMVHVRIWFGKKLVLERKIDIIRSA